VSNFARACTLAELQRKGQLVRQVGGVTLLFVHHDEKVYALDNRCPHMGFPLQRGSLEDGVLTCPWHHARFELCSGGTFDLFADDARSYPVELRGDEVWVDATPQRDEVGYQKKRLREGLERNLPLVLAKACIGLLAHEAEPAELLRIAGVFGAVGRDAGWRDGLTILTAMGSVLPQLADEDKPLALYHGMIHVAANVSRARPHFALEPMAVNSLDPVRLKRWLRACAEVRDRDGVERVLLTAIHAGVSTEVADMLFAAATDHYYLDGGHTIDFVNKAFELLDVIGWEHAAAILPSVIPGITSGTRMEERSAWRNPVDLKALLEPIFAALLRGEFTRDAQQAGRLDDGAFDALSDTLLGDDPEAIAQALADAVAAGTALTEVSQALCYAAALRVARFHTANEFSDWISVLHTFTAANATHQLLKRVPSLEGARGIWHAAMHLYLNRFLNAPAARLPSDKRAAASSEDAGELLSALLELTDKRQQVEEAAAVTYRYLASGHDDGKLMQALAHMLLREDGEFHSYQMLEATLKLYGELKGARPHLAPNVLVALARYLAAHAPTDRASTQTYRIAARLHRGEALAAE
jgi:nitrite reductase/ring-hydroxylating ferredoxin subunit